MKIILASASPRRKALLKVLGLDFEVVVSDAEEKIDCNMSVCETVMKLSLQKAKAVSEKLEKDCIVIGADTVVSCEGKILGKPKDKNEAFEMLKMLSGVKHTVYTGFTVISNSEGKTVTDFDATDVTFKKLSDEEIYNYIENNDVSDKAGAYSIQGTASSFVEKLDGDYNNVVGLPIYKLSKYLYKDYGI